MTCACSYHQHYYSSAMMMIRDNTFLEVNSRINSSLEPAHTHTPLHLLVQAFPTQYSSIVTACNSDLVQEMRLLLSNNQEFRVHACMASQIKVITKYYKNGLFPSIY